MGQLKELLRGINGFLVGKWVFHLLCLCFQADDFFDRIVTRQLRQENTKTRGNILTQYARFIAGGIHKDLYAMGIDP